MSGFHTCVQVIYDGRTYDSINVAAHELDVNPVMLRRMKDEGKATFRGLPIEFGQTETTRHPGRSAREIVCVETGEKFASAARAAEKVGVSSKAIYGAVNFGACIKGLHWAYTGERRVATVTPVTLREKAQNAVESRLKADPTIDPRCLQALYLRLKNGVSLKQLSIELGVSHIRIASLENGVMDSQLYQWLMEYYYEHDNIFHKTVKDSDAGRRLMGWLMKHE